LIKHLTEDVNIVTFSLVAYIIEVCMYDPFNLIGVYLNKQMTNSSKWTRQIKLRYSTKKKWLE